MSETWVCIGVKGSGFPPKYWLGRDEDREVDLEHELRDAENYMVCKWLLYRSSLGRYAVLFVEQQRIGFYPDKDTADIAVELSQ